MHSTESRMHTAAYWLFTEESVVPSDRFNSWFIDGGRCTQGYPQASSNHYKIHEPANISKVHIRSLLPNYGLNRLEKTTWFSCGRYQLSKTTSQDWRRQLPFTKRNIKYILDYLSEDKGPILIDIIHFIIRNEVMFAAVSVIYSVINKLSIQQAYSYFVFFVT